MVKGTSWLAHVALIVLITALAVAADRLNEPASAQAGDAVELLVPDTVRSNGATLRWTRYAGTSFDRYEVHRSASPGFTPTSETLLTTIRNPDVTTFEDTTAAPQRSFSYKIVANASPSGERTVATPAAGTAVKTLQPGPADGEATYLQKGTTLCANNGSTSVLSLGGGVVAERSVLQFDVHDIPAEAQITEATLSLNRETSPAVATTVDVHRLQSEWTEGTSTAGCSGTGATWNETVGGVTWSSSGGDFVSTTAGSTAVASGAAPGWDSFDIRGTLQQWVDGVTPNVGVLLKARDESAGAATLRYTSDDTLTAPDKRPKLLVRYQDGSLSRGPRVKLKSHAAGALISGRSVSLEAEAGDDRRVEKVEFLVDESAVGTDTTEPYAVTWDSATVSTAAHTLTVKATDDVGNTTSEATAVEVANTAVPTTAVTSPSSRYVDLVRAYGPYGYWRLGESGGSTIADSSGKGNGGTLSGGAVLGRTGLLVGDTNTAIKLFNASTDGRATIATLSGQSTQYVSVEAWIYYEGTAPAAVESEIASRGWGSPGGWRLTVYKGGDGLARAKFALNAAGTVYSSTALINAGRNLIAGRYTGSTVGMFSNGAFSYGTTTGSQVLNTTSSMVIGGNLNEDVSVDEFAVYPKSMTSAEAALRYDVGLGRTPMLSGDSNTMVADASDDRSVDRVEFFVDGNYVGNDTAAPYSVPLKTKVRGDELWNGQHTLTSKAYDAEGQERESTTQAVAVDNTGGAAKYAATVAAVTAPPTELTYVAGGSTQDDAGIDVDVTNRGTVAWSAADIVLRPRWIAPDGAISEQPEVALASDLPAGQTRRATIKVKPPAPAEGTTKAHYTLRVDPFSKTDNAYFGDRGNKPLDTPVVIKKDAGNLGLERFFHYEGEELGGGMQHLANLATGNSLVRFTPLSSDGRGLATVVDLTYNALEEKSESPVGSNWSLSISSLTRFGTPLDVHPNKADDIGGNPKRYIDITDGDGTTHRFTGKQASDGKIYWEEPAGVHLYLREHSATDPLRKWAISRPDGVTHFFGSDGYPTSVEDKNGNRLTFTLESVPPGEDPGGQKTRITSVTDAGGQSYRITYWSKAAAPKPKIRGNVRKITDHSGIEITFTYYHDGNLLRIGQTGGTTAEGAPLASRAWYFTYTTPSGDGPAIPNAADRVHPSASTASQSTRLYSVRDPLHGESTFTYLAGVTTGQHRWKLASRTDRRGARTTYAYDAATSTTTVTAPESRVSKYVFDSSNQVTKITNALNEDTLVAWTPDRHVERVTTPREGTPATATRRFAYNQNGLITDTWNEMNEQTHLDYTDLKADANDVSGKWKTGRNTPHLSRLNAKTDPKGTATPAVADDFRWTFEYDSADTLGNLVKVIDPEGDTAKSTRIQPNADGTTAAITDPNGNTTSFPTYHHSGQPAKLVDGEGRITQFGYDDDGFLRWIQDPVHAADTGANPREYRTYFDYDSWHRMGRQSTPKSTRGKRGELIWSAARFDSNDNITDGIAPHYGAQYTGTGSLTQTQFDAMDRPELITGPDKRADTAGERWKLSYDTAGRLKTVTQPGGMFTLADDKDGMLKLDYDKLDRVFHESRDETNGVGVVTRTLHTHYCYDVAGDLRATVPPSAEVTDVDCTQRPTLPKATRLTYDEAHRLVAEQEPGKAETKTGYNANGDVESMTDEAGNTTRQEYDERGLPTKRIEPFDLDGRKITSKLEYDAGGRLIREVSPRAWDTAPDRSSYADAEYVTDYVYDRADQLVRIDLPNAGTATRHHVHRSYDPNGNLASTTLPTETASAADAPSELKSLLTYFDTGWVESSDDKTRRKVTYDYFAEGWQHTRTPLKPDGSEDLDRQRTWNYYADGMLSDEKVGEKYDLSTFTYDADNDLKKAHDESGTRNSTKDKPIDVEITYDTLDQPTLIRHSDSRRDDRWIRTDYGYDFNGNVSRRVDNIEETTAGSLVKAGRVNTFAYDDADWLETHTDENDPAKSDDTRVVEYDYKPTGWEDFRTITQNGAVRQTTDWDYYLNGQLRTLFTMNKDGTTKESHEVFYRDGETTGVYLNGHRGKDVWRRASAKAGAPCQSENCTSLFEYDVRDRLKSERTLRPSVADKAITYQLDPAGNVKEETRTGWPDGQLVKQSEYTADRLDRQTVTQGTVSKTFRYHHDGFGNLACVTTDTGTREDCPASRDASPSPRMLSSYIYDKDDRLASYRTFDPDSHSVTNGARYDYDVFDRPVEENEDHTGFSDPRRTLFRYIGIGDELAEEEQRKVPRKEPGVIGSFDEDAAGSLDETKGYSYDAYGRRVAMSATEPATPTDKVEEYTYGQDTHGSVSLLLDNAGAAKASYGYTAYGEVDEELTGEQDQNGALRSEDSRDPLNPYRYTGKRQDTGSDTLDMGARRFAPEVSRFLQEDVLQDALGDVDLSTDPLTGNRYGLAGGSPVSFVELDGHGPCNVGACGSARQASRLNRRAAQGYASAQRRQRRPGPVNRYASQGGPPPSWTFASRAPTAAPRTPEGPQQSRADVAQEPRKGGILDRVGGEIKGVTGLRPFGDPDTEGFQQGDWLGDKAGWIIPGGGLGKANKLRKVVTGAKDAAKGADDAAGGVYSLRDEAGNVVRTGRSNNLARREGEHFRDPELGQYRFRPEFRTDDYATQRGLEQLLHDEFLPPLNRIRPISPLNPRRSGYLDAARRFREGG